MPVVDVTKDLDARTLTVTAHFAAPVERVWQVYADARQLERVWGPPGFPATVVEHDLTPGGAVKYYMTGPDGATYPGMFRVRTVEEPSLLEFDDVFTDADYAPTAGPTSHSSYTFTEHDGGTRVVYTSVYDSAEAMQQILDMGVEEGLTQAIDQIDDVVAA